MAYEERIHQYILEHKEEMIHTLKELVGIPSVRGEAEPGTPFGKACAQVLEYTKALYEKNGFESELDNEGGYTLSYYGEGNHSLGLFAHGDVVPVGDDWSLTSPFEVLEKDGFLVGRGVMDDKAAIVISLYCAKMLKELEIPFHSRLICFTGGNEESGMQDIKNYVVTHKAPDFSLVCDTGYPPYRGNKGMLQFDAVCDIPLEKIVHITGSNVKGSILGKAMAGVIVDGHRITITAEGVSKHTALPEGSANAGGILAGVLKDAPYLTANDRRIMKFVSEMLTHYYGETVRIENDDPEFGRLTFANDMLELKNGRLSLHFNLRFGAAIDISKLKEQISEYFAENGWRVEFLLERLGAALDKNDSYLQTCLDVYKRFTGRQDAEALINAGGTYAAYLPCAIETGPTLIWDYLEEMKEGHGGVHQPDEHISIDGFLQAMELTMQMLLACDRRNGE